MGHAEDPEFIRDLFAAFGPVGLRRMFGGAGLFADGVMFALIDDGVIYLKADEHTVPAFKRASMAPFAYRTKRGERALTSYWRMPQHLYDDPDELARWATEALAAARRGSGKKRAVRRKGPAKRARTRN